MLCGIVDRNSLHFASLFVRKGFKPNTVMTVTHDVSNNKPSRVEAAVSSLVFAIPTVALPTAYLYQLSIMASSGQWH